MDIIRAVAAHRIAPNLLMLVMLLSGLFVIGRMEVRFFPEFETRTARVSASWRGAAAEDVSEALLTPLENELRDVPDLEKMTSVARGGGGIVYMEFPESADMQKATDDVRRHVDLATAKLPADAERPEVSEVERHDDVMRLSLSGDSLVELRRLARRLEAELARLGVARVEVSGLPKDEIQIRASQRRLAELRLTPRDIGRQLAAQNIDATAGDIGDGDANVRLLRVIAKRKEIADFANMTIVDGGGNVVRLGDIADISRGNDASQTEIFFNSKPAVEFRLTRKSGGNMLEVADKVRAWAAQTRSQLPAGAALTEHRERWRAVQSRIDLLAENGLQGLAVVALLLLLFLRGRLAFWVAAGIPATFMVALAVLHFSGGSLNMISLFAFIMTTGIVVDDAIVVGENGVHKLRQGAPPFVAAVEGAREMFPSVFSSTFTTIASFAPLLLVGGTIGAIMFAIPLVVICVLLASLFECFLVLPGHMRGAFASIAASPPRGWRRKIDDAFQRFQDGPFRHSARLALRHRWITITAAFAALILTFALIAGGLLQYRFFPGAELNRVQAQVAFVAGTSRETVRQFMEELTQSARQAAADFPDEDNLLRHISVYLGQGGRDSGAGEELASMWIELPQPDERDISSREFVRAWRGRLPNRAGLERLTLREARGGPSGEDLEIRLSGAGDLKSAALELRTAMTDIPGVLRPSDDTPFGRRQAVFDLTARGRALNLTVEGIARQLRDAFDGYRAQTLQDGLDEIDVRVFSDGGLSLSDFRVRLPDGSYAALADIVTLRERRGIDTIQRVDSRPVVNVVANIDFNVANADRVIRQLRRDVLPDIAARHGVAYSFEGGRADERETVADMKTGLIIALLGIFVILAAVFSSWTLPIAILLTVPFGVIGAMLGHWLLGYDMSILSAFGVFTLNGIIINDSIILVREYMARCRAAAPDADDDEIIVAAVCRRLRAILLTSLTTVGGLMPLLFERSTQAQFLIPMAISISFGLIFATFLILYLTPAFLSVHNGVARFLARQRLALAPVAADKSPT